MEYNLFSDLTSVIGMEYLPISTVLLRLVVAGILGLTTSFIYRLYSKEAYIKDFQHSLIFLTLIIAASLMVIGDNLASAFGLVGAVSIIRFKTAVKSTRDMAFVLFNIVIGMSCGLGFLLLAAISFLFISSVMIIIYIKSQKSNFEKRLVYKIESSSKDELLTEDLLESIFERYDRKYKLISYSNSKKSIKYTYNVTVHNRAELFEIVKAISSHDGVDIKSSLFEV